MNTLHWVTPLLATSGHQNLADERDLQAAGIKAIVNLSQRPDPHWSIPYIDDGQPDDGEPKPLMWYAHAIHFALLHIHARQPVLIHCEAGIHRSPSMAYAVMRAMGRSREEATQMVMRSTPGAKLDYANGAETHLADLGHTA